MITDDQMDAAVAYVTDDEIIAEATYKLAVAENTTARTYADLLIFYHGVGGVEARKAHVTIHPDYQDALSREAEAKRDLVRVKARINSAEKIIEIWRTINANTRNAERVR